MSTIKVCFSSSLREAAGTAEAEVEIRAGASLAELMQELARLYGPGAVGRSLEYQWRHGAGYVLAELNGRQAQPGDWASLEVREGDRLCLFPPLAGG